MLITVITIYRDLYFQETMILAYIFAYFSQM